MRRSPAEESLTISRQGRQPHSSRRLNHNSRRIEKG
jgi:hypothetical protein